VKLHATRDASTDSRAPVLVTI